MEKCKLLPTRLVLVDLPRLLREIVEDSLSGAPSVELVGAVDGGAAADMVVAVGADFAVLGHDDRSLVLDMLAARPSMKVLAILRERNEAALYELQPKRIPLGELSPARLVAVITGEPSPLRPGSTA